MNSPSKTSPLELRDGFEIYFRNLRRVFSDPKLSTWYRRTILKTALLSAAILFFIVIVGIYAIQYFIPDFSYAVFPILVLVIVAVYFSATLSAFFMNSLVLVIGGEGALRAYFFPGQRPRGGLQLKERGGELLSVGKSLIFALVALPFWLSAWLIPVGVAIIALGLGGEALATAQRLAHEYGTETAQDRRATNWRVYLGLGLIPALTAMIPIFGFLFLPVAVIAAIDLQLTKPKE